MANVEILDNIVEYAKENPSKDKLSTYEKIFGIFVLKVLWKCNFFRSKIFENFHFHRNFNAECYQNFWMSKNFPKKQLKF